MNSIKLTIGNGEYECHFGLGFLGELMEAVNLDYDTFFSRYEKNPIKYVPLTLFHSIKYGVERKGNELDIEYHQLLDIIDENGGLQSESLIKFSHAFIDSVVKNVPKDELKKEGAKKK